MNPNWNHLARAFCVAVVLFASVGVARAQPLPEHRALTAHVASIDGAPVPNLEIHLLRPGDAGPVATWSTFEVTDALGNFSLANLEDGPYIVQLRAPNVDYKADVGAFTLDPDHTHWDIVVKPIATLLLHLTGPDGAPVRATPCTYILSMLDAAGKPGAVLSGTLPTDGDGTLAIHGLEAGTYGPLSIYVRGIGYAIHSDPTSVAAPGADDLALALAAGGSLRLKVFDTDRDGVGGLPPPDARPMGGVAAIVLKAAANEPALTALAFSVPSFAGSTTDDGSGERLYPNLPPGSYTIGLQGIDGDRIVNQDSQSVQLEDGATAQMTLYVKRVPAPALKLNFANDEDHPLALTRLKFTLLAAGQPFGNPRIALSDGIGNVTLYPMPPGDWYLNMCAIDANGDPIPNGFAVGKNIHLGREDLAMDVRVLDEPVAP